MPYRIFLLLFVLSVALTLYACSGDSPTDDDIGSDHPPNIDTFLPDSLNILAPIGEDVTFTIVGSDPDNNSLQYAFYVDDVLTATSPLWSYTVEGSGPVTVRGSVTDGMHVAMVEWQVVGFTPPPIPDVTPPAVVNLTTIILRTLREDGADVTAIWSGVGDDGMQGRPEEYDLRYSHVPIVDEATWEAAEQLSNEPPPGAAGSAQLMFFSVPAFEDSVWVSIRAIDDAGNVSPIGNTLGAGWKKLGGTVRNAVTGEPIGGVQIIIDGVPSATLEDGTYLAKLPPKSENFIEVRDETNEFQHGEYFDIEGWYTVGAELELDFWMLPNWQMTSTKYPDFLNFFKRMAKAANSPGNPYGNTLRTWQIPFDVYVPPKIRDGHDFQALVYEAYAMWETALGFELVNFVDSPPEVGVRVEWVGDEGRDLYLVEERDARLFPKKGRIQLRTSTPLSVFRKVSAHECGHSFGIDHSQDGIHIMVGFQAVIASEPHEDEIWLGKAMHNIPRGTDMDRYIWE